MPLLGASQTRTANEQVEPDPVQVCYTPGNMERRHCHLLHRTAHPGKGSRLCSSPQLATGESSPSFSCSFCSFCFPPSLPGNLKVHVCHLLWAPQLKFYAYKHLSTSFEQQHSLNEANQLVQVLQYSSVQPPPNTLEPIGSAKVMNHRFRGSYYTVLKLLDRYYYCFVG